MQEKFKAPFIAVQNFNLNKIQSLLRQIFPTIGWQNYETCLREYDYVLIDCPPVSQDSRASVVEQVDEIYIVSTPDVAALSSGAGGVSPRLLLGALIRRPLIVRELLAVAVAARTCSRALSDLHRELLRGL